MGFLTTLLTGFALSMDAFAVSVTKGMTLRKINILISLKIAFLFGLFQGLMPLLGWFAGIRFQSYITAVDHWIALFLLSFIGLKMIFEAYEDIKNPELTVTCDGEISNKDLIILSIATSIDALAVGISLAMTGDGIVEPALVIGVVTMLISMCGVWIGSRFGDRYGKKAELVGGAILILIGLRIVLEHTRMI